MKIKKSRTPRGFGYAQFTDCIGQGCSAQDSSSIEPALWLGVENTGPNITGPLGKYSENVSVRMHLKRKDVCQLIKLLQSFVDNGSVK